MRLFGRQRAPPRAPPETGRWPMDAPLLHLPPQDALTLRDSLAGGISIMGATSSGKSSGPIQTILRAMLMQGWGLLLLCAKNTDADTYFRYAREAGRAGQVIRVTADGPWRYNWLAEEIKRPGGTIENLLHLLTGVLLEIVEGRQMETASDPYWQRAAKVLLRNSLSLLAAAEHTIRLDDLARLVASGPQSLEQVQDPAWQARSYCARLIAGTDKLAALAHNREIPEAERSLAHEMTVAHRYFLQEFAAMSDRTRSSIVSTLTASIDLMMHGTLYRLFGAAESSFTPDVLDKGGIVLVDLPLVEFGEVARITGQLLKFLTQRTLLRRQKPERPCAIVVDEAQNYVSSFDWEFAAMSRSQRATSVYATQGLQNYYAKLGVGAEAAVRALLSQFQTHIFCRNNDVYTNQFAADLIARRWSTRMGSSSQNSMGGPSYGTSTNQSLEYPIQPGEFLHLRNGGPQHRYCVDGLMVGRTWSHGDVYLPVTFHQNPQA